MADTEALILRYRPKTWEEVVGHKSIATSVANVVEKRSSHAFLFTGEPGVGKTTFARLIASYLGVTGSDLLEIDAATYTSIDDMRAITQTLMYRPMDDEVKVIIVDEAHAASKSALTSLLKSVEEPPEWVFWIFCTTDANRIPDTIRSRCAAYHLDPVDNDDLFQFLDDVAYDEKLEVDGGVLQVCVKEAHGSPRQALSNLAICSECKTRQEAADMLRSAGGGDDTNAGKLAAALIGGKSWEIIHPILQSLQTTEPESIRFHVRGYLTKVIMGDKAGSEKAILGLLPILEAFATPFPKGDGITPIVLAVGRILFGGEPATP